MINTSDIHHDKHKSEVPTLDIHAAEPLAESDEHARPMLNQAVSLIIDHELSTPPSLSRIMIHESHHSQDSTCLNKGPRFLDATRPSETHNNTQRSKTNDNTQTTTLINMTCFKHMHSAFTRGVDRQRRAASCQGRSRLGPLRGPEARAIIICIRFSTTIVIHIICLYVL